VGFGRDPFIDSGHNVYDIFGLEGDITSDIEAFQYAPYSHAVAYIPHQLANTI
jgi:hypothetical protein